MSQHEAPARGENPSTPRGHAPWGALASLLAVVLFLGAVVAFWIAPQAAVLGSPENALFDMDVNRVASDWTTFEPSGRARVHPLYKFVALPGSVVRLGFEAAGMEPARLHAARLLALLLVTGVAGLAGVLAWRLSGGERMAAIVAAAVCGTSFASLLLCAVPDSASGSAWFSLLPVLLLLSRRGAPLGWREGLAWAALGVGAFGITISQIAPWGIALLFRFAWQEERPRLGKRLGMQALGVAAPMALAIFVLLHAQHAIFQESEIVYKIDEVLEKEFKYFETDELVGAPGARLARLATTWGLHSFAAPRPVIAYWSPPRETRRFLSITLVEEGWRGWGPAAVPLLLSQAALLLLWLRHARWTPLAWPIAAILVQQAAMHVLYGREFIMYALNWHPLLVALIVATTPARHWRKPWLVAWVALHVAMMAASNLAVLHHTMWLYENEFPVQEAFSIIEPPQKSR